MSLLAIVLLIFLVLLLFGGLPHMPYMAGRSWGYGPSGIIFVLLVIVLVLAIAGRI